MYYLNKKHFKLTYPLGYYLNEFVKRKIEGKFDKDIIKELIPDKSDPARASIALKFNQMLRGELALADEMPVVKRKSYYKKKYPKRKKAFKKYLDNQY